jgi:DNA-binding transcriptional ArsR family regulator
MASILSLGFEDVFTSRDIRWRVFIDDGLTALTYLAVGHVIVNFYWSHFADHESSTMISNSRSATVMQRTHDALGHRIKLREDKSVGTAMILRERGMTIQANGERTSLLPQKTTEVLLLAKFFRALSETARLRLLAFLLDEEHTVNECVAHVGLSQGRVSSHLACLADCGYVQVRRVGRRAFYRVTDPRIVQLVLVARSLSDANAAGLAACHRIDPPRVTAAADDNDITTP